MIEHFARIERHRAEVRRIEGDKVILSDGGQVTADLLLWATGYATDMSYIASPALAAVRNRDELAQQCGGLVRAKNEPGLYFMSVGLESTGSAPHAFAHMARTIVTHIRGKATLGLEPVTENFNYFDVPKFLARFDPENTPEGRWQADYQEQAKTYPAERPLPIPV